MDWPRLNYVFGLCAQVKQGSKFYDKVVSQVPHMCTSMTTKIIGYVLDSEHSSSR